MTLNRFGKMVATHWKNLKKHHPHVQLDEFVIMPNHVHGIIVLTHVESANPLGGEGFDYPVLDNTDPWTTKPALINPSRSHSSSSNQKGDRAVFGDQGLEKSERLLAKLSPMLPLQLDAGVGDHIPKKGDHAIHMGCDRAGFGDHGSAKTNPWSTKPVMIAPSL